MHVPNKSLKTLDLWVLLRQKLVIDRQLYFWIKEEHKLEQKALNVACVVWRWLLRSAVSASIVA